MKPEGNPEPLDSEFKTKRYLTFSLGHEDYAVPLLYVKEVIAVPEVTPIPFTPSHFLGIMNLRGQVISLIDLRQKLGIKSDANAETSVIICDLSPLVIGVVVDSINAVVEPTQDEISASPEVQGSKNTDYITGVYRKDKRLILLLEIAKVLGMEDLRLASQKNASHRAA